jgi:hypothetical protein
VATLPTSDALATVSIDIVEGKWAFADRRNIDD